MLLESMSLSDRPTSTTASLAVLALCASENTTTSVPTYTAT